MQGLAALGQPRRAVEQNTLGSDFGGDLLAAGLVAGAAVAALPTRRHPRQHDVVAHREGGDALAEFDHHARTLVPHHQRCGRLPVAALDVQIGVAHAGGGDLDADLAALRTCEVDVGELDGSGGVSEDDGFHTVPWLGDESVEWYESKRLPSLRKSGNEPSDFDIPYTPRWPTTCGRSRTISRPRYRRAPSTSRRPSREPSGSPSS